MKIEKIDELCVNTIRTLSMDAVQQANSGHPGTPMALAPVVYCLWQNFLRFDPEDPIWPNRDDSFVGDAPDVALILHLCEVKSVNAKCESVGRLRHLEDIGSPLDSKCPGIRNIAGRPASKRRPVR